MHNQRMSASGSISSTARALAMHRPLPPWLTRAGVWLLIALSIGIWGFSGVQRLNITDFEALFLPSARVALAGHPLEVYSGALPGRLS